MCEFACFVCVLAGVAGRSSVACAATVAAERVPRLRAATAVLTVVGNTPVVTHGGRELLHTRYMSCKPSEPLSV